MGKDLKKRGQQFPLDMLVLIHSNAYQIASYEFLSHQIVMVLVVIGMDKLPKGEETTEIREKEFGLNPKEFEVG